MSFFKKLFGGGLFAPSLLLPCPQCGRSLNVPCLPQTVVCPGCQMQWGCLYEPAPALGTTYKLALCLRCGGNLVPFHDVDIAQKAFDEVEEEKILSDPSTKGTIWRCKWVWTKCAKCGETKKVPVSEPRS